MLLETHNSRHHIYFNNSLYVFSLARCTNLQKSQNFKWIKSVSKQHALNHGILMVLTCTISIQLQHLWKCFCDFPKWDLRGIPWCPSGTWRWSLPLLAMSLCPTGTGHMQYGSASNMSARQATAHTGVWDAVRLLAWKGAGGHFVCKLVWACQKARQYAWVLQGLILPS